MGSSENTLNIAENLINYLSLSCQENRFCVTLELINSTFTFSNMKQEQSWSDSQLSVACS